MGLFSEGDNVKADPFAQLKLWDVQQLDTKSDQLSHRKQTLPEHGQLQSLQVTHADIKAQAQEAQIRVNDLASAQRKIDTEVETVKARRSRDQARIDAGEVPNPKDLERMLHEMESLKRRIDELEDAELEIMEELEEATTQYQTLRARLTEIGDQGTELLAQRDRQAAEIDRELSDLAVAREALVAELPEDLLALYHRLRESKKGAGAALLRARQCSGCQLSLDPAELARVKAASPEEIVRCAECQRILVRTHESGL
jgi:uncharacterized protein